jgi:hypothetical protein
MADIVRQRQYEGKANVRFDCAKNGRLRKIVVYSHGDDYALSSHRGNPQEYSHDTETATNPPRVWEFKRQCGERAGGRHI